VLQDFVFFFERESVKLIVITFLVSRKGTQKCQEIVKTKFRAPKFLRMYAGRTKLPDLFHNSSSCHTVTTVLKQAQSQISAVLFVAARRRDLVKKIGVTQLEEITLWNAWDDQ
jgi:hypothetical protein